MQQIESNIIEVETYTVFRSVTNMTLTRSKRVNRKWAAPRAVINFSRFGHALPSENEPWEMEKKICNGAHLFITNLHEFEIMYVNCGHVAEDEPPENIPGWVKPST